MTFLARTPEAVSPRRTKGRGRLEAARRWIARALVLPLLLVPAGCAVNPATGEPSFTLFMSQSEEIRIGREMHPQVLSEFGGAYEDPAIQRYVDSIGQLLARTTETPERQFTFTVLNSPIVNALAIPGGYVYVTRGLMALASDEAELAGVVGHEIGHVVARHSAERYSQSVLASLGAAALGIATGSRAAGDLAQLGGLLYLTSYSRQQEYEADLLGVRYMTRAGFEPGAMADFLTALERQDALEAKLRGKSDAGESFSLLATHPRTRDRVVQAIKAAGTARPPNPIDARDIYLGKIDGMLYGDDPEEGFIRGREFAHPKLRFRFEVPPGYRLLNSKDAVIAIGPGKARILFDKADKPAAGPMTYYLEEIWARGATLGDVEPITVNGLEAATGWIERTLDGGRFNVRLVAIRVDVQTIYRFIFLTPVDLFPRLREDLQRTTFSFRLLTPAEAAALKPKRLRVVTVQPGDTVESLARRMPYAEFREERFRVLNGLAPGEPVRPGQRVKTVVE